MSFTRQLSEMSASELNDAIDDTNFPQAHVLSRGRNNSVCSTSSTSGTSSLMDRNLSQTDEIVGVNAVSSPIVAGGGGFSGGIVSGGSILDNIVGDNGTGAIIGGTSSKAVSNRPKLILKTNGTINENDSASTPITPMTPRTSTTPGSGWTFVNIINFIYRILAENKLPNLSPSAWNSGHFCL